MAEKFVYGGYTFEPVRQWTRKENRDVWVGMKGLVSEYYAGGCQAIGLGGETWSYQGFYKASGGSECDIFRCAANGLLYVPAGNELFRWVGDAG